MGSGATQPAANRVKKHRTSNIQRRTSNATPCDTSLVVGCWMLDVGCSPPIRTRQISSTVLIAFHKPYGVISQFSSDGSDFRTLAEFGFPPRVYPIGRLDADSEGLLLLSDEPELNERLLHPRQGHRRMYWAEVVRIPSPESLQRLAQGVPVQGRTALPC